MISCIKGADLVLGIFSSGDKTDRVVANKVIEGLAAGRPVITADTTAIRASFEPGRELVVVPAGSGEALAEQIIALKDDPVKRERIAAAGLEAAGRFGLSTLVHGWSNLVSEL